MRVIGITGGIGAGKSTVSEILASLGLDVINVDELGHQVYLPSTSGWNEVVKEFGKEVLTEDGEINRSKLRAKVFDDSRALGRLNQITHPKIRQLLSQSILDRKNAGSRIIGFEAALLIEADWKELADQIWVVTAPKSVIIDRVARRSPALDNQTIQSMIESQMSQSEREKFADIIIENSGTVNELKKIVQMNYNHTLENLFREK